jgi:predicted metal-dependent peptidase
MRFAWGDTRCTSRRLDEPKGGGGTDFDWIAAEADSVGAHVVVYIGDAQGPMRIVPRVPLIWCVDNEYTTPPVPGAATYRIKL